MQLREFIEKEPEAYQDLEADNTQLKKSDLRKSKLTLRQLNKLRKMNDLRKFEHNQKLKKIQKQYGAAPAAPEI